MSRSNKRSFRVLVPAAALAALSAACGSPATGAGALDLRPATVEEAKATAEQLRGMVAANPNDAETLAAVSTFHANLDELNHLVARVTPVADHVVSFFDTGDGSVIIKESRPKGEPSVLADVNVSDLSNAALYRRLSGGQEPPEALAKLDLPNADAVSEERAAGLVSTSDEAQPASTRFKAEGLQAFNCYYGGDYHACQPGWWNGGWYTWNTKTSFLEIEPIVGGTIYIQFSYNSGQSGSFMDPALNNGYVSSYWARSGVVTSRNCGFLGLGSCTYQSDYVIGNHAWTLVNASGSEFNWSTEARWNCTWQGCTSP